MSLKREDGIYVRDEFSVPLGTGDADVFRAEVERINAKSVLEFGPGESTQIFLDMGIGRIVTCEHIDRWLKVAKKRFKGDDRCKVIPYTNTFPVEADLNGEKFDLALVDSPQGYQAARKVHPGYADCNRLNTLLFALQHAKVVLLHDAFRPLERGALGRLSALGYNIEFIENAKYIGIARIESLELHTHKSDTPGAAKPRGASAGSKPKRGRGGVNRRSDRLGPGRPEKKKHSGRSPVVVNADDSDGVPSPARAHRGKRGTNGVRSDQRNGAVRPVPESGAGLEGDAAG